MVNVLQGSAYNKLISSIRDLIVAQITTKLIILEQT